MIIDLTYPPLDNFWQILGLHSPVIGQEILCFLEFCYHYSRKAKESFLLCTFQKILHTTQVSLLRESVISNFRVFLSLYHIVLFKAKIILGMVQWLRTLVSDPSPIFSNLCLFITNLLLPFPEYSMLSSSLWGHRAYLWFTDIYVVKITIHVKTKERSKEGRHEGRKKDKVKEMIQQAAFQE